MSRARALFAVVTFFAAASLLLYRGRLATASNDAWKSQPMIHRVLNEHIELYRESLADSRILPVSFELDFNHVALHDCSSLLSLIWPHEGYDWYTVHAKAPMCPKLHSSADTSPHRIIFLDTSSGIEASDALDHLKSTITCRDCSSLAMIVYSSEQVEAERLMDDLLDMDMRLTILLDITPSEGAGFVFALCRLPLRRAEQQHLKDLTALQTSAIDCSKQKFILHPVLSSGLGAIFSRVTQLGMYAVSQGRAVVLLPNNEFKYADMDICTSMHPSCAFHSVLLRQHQCQDYILDQLASRPGSLSREQASKSTIAFVTSTLQEHNRDPEEPFWYWDWPGFTGTDNEPDPKYRDYMARHDLRPQGALLGLLTAQPRKFLRDAVTDQVRENRPLGRYMGMHVRHGDKKLEAALVPFSGYMAHADRIATAASIRDVFLATDNQTLVDEDSKTYGRYEWHAQDVNRYGSDQGGWWYSQKQSAYDRLVELLVDASILSRADAFIGSAHSGYTHLVNAMRALTKPYATYEVRSGGKMETVDFDRHLHVFEEVQRQA